MDGKETQPTIVGEKSESGHPSPNRRTILKLLIVGCLATALLVYAVQMMGGSANNLETAKERNNMFAAKTTQEQYRAIPPIDARVPVKIETATFALG